MNVRAKCPCKNISSSFRCPHWPAAIARSSTGCSNSVRFPRVPFVFLHTIGSRGHYVTAKEVTAVNIPAQCWRLERQLLEQLSAAATGAAICSSYWSSYLQQLLEQLSTAAIGVAICSSYWSSYLQQLLEQLSTAEPGHYPCCENFPNFLAWKFSNWFWASSLIKSNMTAFSSRLLSRASPTLRSAFDSRPSRLSVCTHKVQKNLYRYFH